MLASTKKLQAALGRTPEEECRKNVHLLVPHLRGFAGLLFTNLSHEEAEASISGCEQDEFARAGCVASQTVRTLKLARERHSSVSSPVRNWCHVCTCGPASLHCKLAFSRAARPILHLRTPGLCSIASKVCSV
jgi:hypothetical protein